MPVAAPATATATVTASASRRATALHLCARTHALSSNPPPLKSTSSFSPGCSCSCVCSERLTFLSLGLRILSPIVYPISLLFFNEIACLVATHLRSTNNSSLITKPRPQLQLQRSVQATTPDDAFSFLLVELRSPPYGLQAVTHLGRSIRILAHSLQSSSPFIPALDAFLLHIRSGANCMCLRHIGCYGRLHCLSHYWRNISCDLIADADFLRLPSCYGSPARLVLSGQDCLY